MTRIAPALILVAACTGDHMQVGSVYIKSGDVGAAGGSLAVTSSDYASLAGTSITIPAGALTATTRIGIGLGDGDIVSAAAAGPSLVFAPQGTALAKPAAITMPYENSSMPGQLHVHALLAGALTDLSSRIVRVDSGLVTFELDTLAEVQANLTPNGSGSNDPSICGADGSITCAPGYACNATGDQCVAQCGMNGAITFLCSDPADVCDFSTGTCHH